MLVAIAALAFFAAADPIPADVTNDVTKLLADQDAAWSKHDAAAFAALFTDDATCVSPMGTRATGKTELVALFSQPGPTKKTSSSTVLLAVQALSADLFLVDARQTLSGPGVAELGGNTANLTAVVKRVDGKMRFVAARPTAAPPKPHA